MKEQKFFSFETGTQLSTSNGSVHISENYLCLHWQQIPSEVNSFHTLFGTELVQWSPAQGIKQETARRKVFCLVL